MKVYIIKLSLYIGRKFVWSQIRLATGPDAHIEGDVLLRETIDIYLLSEIGTLIKQQGDFWLKKGAIKRTSAVLTASEWNKKINILAQFPQKSIAYFEKVWKIVEAELYI